MRWLAVVLLAISCLRRRPSRCSGFMKRFASAAGVVICGSILPLSGGRAESTTICGQTVNYVVAPPASDVSPELRVLSGIWVGDTGTGGGVNETTMCIGFVIESIRSDAAVSAKYVRGDKVKFLAGGATRPIKPGVNTWEGKVTGGVLHFVSADGKYSFDLRVTNPNEMRGIFSTPTGPGNTQVSRRR